MNPPLRSSLVLYSRTGALVDHNAELNNVENKDSQGHTNVSDLSPSPPFHHLHDQLLLQHQKRPPRHPYPKPTLLQRAYLRGLLLRPRDIGFLVRFLVSVTWSLLRLHCIELPYLIATRFQRPSKQHPLGWSWIFTIMMAFTRSAASSLRTTAQMRFIGVLMEAVLSSHVPFIRQIKVQHKVQFRVRLEPLLRYERATLAPIRHELDLRGCSDDPLNPSLDYLESMHPPAFGPHARLANIPEEVGHLDDKGEYLLVGEWIEATGPIDIEDPRSRSKTVVLYFHGGGHAFLSPASHRAMLCRMAKAIGPGTRIFSVDYRMPPEHPFPAAIHDALAAYLYLTQPDHEAIRLTGASAKERVPIDPRNLVVGGDSAGANLAAAFGLYMKKYVQPSVTPKFVLPHANLLLSAWMDITSTLPAARRERHYCYCPGPLGPSPFDKQDYMNFKLLNLANLYICGDVDCVPNARNALGKERRWEWYRHLVQHPLVIPVHHANVSNLANTLVQTGTHDRLLDDNRLYAHRIGLENPNKLTRIEIYNDMVHVHQIFSFLNSGCVALDNIARFIGRSRFHRDQEEGVVNPDEIGRGGYGPDHLFKNMVNNKSDSDGVEWVTVVQSGKEIPEMKSADVKALFDYWSTIILREP